jgi:hypothetical protein
MAKLFFSPRQQKFLDALVEEAYQVPDHGTFTPEQVLLIYAGVGRYYTQFELAPGAANIGQVAVLLDRLPQHEFDEVIEAIQKKKDILDE